MEKISAAVIGCGRMGAFTSDSVKNYSPSCWLPLSHIEALLAHQQIDLQAICDNNQELLNKASASYGIQQTYNDYKTLLKDLQPDICCIATRTPVRTDIITTGIEYGVKAFHIEKPLCNSVKQLEQIETLSREKNILFTYGTIRRYLPIYQQAKALLDSGQFGQLTQIQVNFGSGPLFWGHPHSVDMILYYAGIRKLETVHAHLENVITASKPSHIESDPIIAAATISFDDGLMGVICKANGMDVVLSCTDGEIIIEGDGRSIITRGHSEQDPYYPYPGQIIRPQTESPQGTYSALKHLVSHLTDPNQAFDKEHIFLGQRILFAFCQSHLNQGQQTPITQLDPDMNIQARSGNLSA